MNAVNDLHRRDRCRPVLCLSADQHQLATFLFIGRVILVKFVIDWPVPNSLSLPEEIHLLTSQHDSATDWSLFFVVRFLLLAIFLSLVFIILLELALDLLQANFVFKTDQHVRIGFTVDRKVSLNTVREFERPRGDLLPDGRSGMPGEKERLQFELHIPCSDAHQVFRKS